MVSNICYVNKGGIDKPKTPNEKKHYRYPHPSICLIKRRAYLVSPYKFINHGAPAINIAIGLDTEKDSKILVDAPEIFSYFGTQRRGTVSIYGYNYKKVPWEETIS
jgi:hypothetical protein